MNRPTLWWIVLILTGWPAFAEETKCAMTYEQFEFAVPHIDLESCPSDLAADGRFCRAGTATDMVHIFAFEEADSQCLVGVTSLDEDRFTLLIE